MMAPMGIKRLTGNKIGHPCPGASSKIVNRTTPHAPAMAMGHLGPSLSAAHGHLRGAPTHGCRGRAFETPS